MASIGDIDLAGFRQGYEDAFNTPLAAPTAAALGAVLGFINAEPTLTDPRWIAYILATIRHETGGNWRPQEERGHGAGHAYGRPVRVTDPASGRLARNVYYGRGYIQLTWLRNYKRLDEKLGLRNRLWLRPATALEPPVAWRICCSGMSLGLFTGKGLGDYIDGAACDYVGARRIVNGQDQAHLVAAYAVSFEGILEDSIA